MSLTGKWTLSAEAMGQPIKMTMDLTQIDENFSGEITSMFGGGNITDGKIVNGDVTATANVAVAGQELSIKLTGKTSGNSMAGTLSSPLGNIPFTAEQT
jgi:hypothetical protein